jgi:hypothetical protein
MAAFFAGKIRVLLFYMETDFRKLKAPLIWYDILRFADTLSNYQYDRQDRRLKDMVNLIAQRADKDEAVS